jgi:hypothetical protein
MNDVERQKVEQRVSEFLKRHESPMSRVASHVTHVFEAACFVIFARHYEEVGYQLKPRNLLDGKFRFRYSTAGYPWNFSHFGVLSREQGNNDKDRDTLFELHHNQKVAGAWVHTGEGDDKALFAVDIAVVRAASLPDLPRGHKRTDEPYWVENEHLITFGEAKKLTAYPMLMAQFLGIVHEIKPEFLKVQGWDIPQAFWDEEHPPPTLLTANHLTFGTKQVLHSFKDRDLAIRVVEDVTGLPEDALLRKLRGADEEQDSETDEEVPF